MDEFEQCLLEDEDEDKMYSSTLILPGEDAKNTFILQNFSIQDKIVMPCSRSGIIVINYSFRALVKDYNTFIQRYPDKEIDESGDDGDEF